MPTDTIGRTCGGGCGLNNPVLSPTKADESAGAAELEGRARPEKGEGGGGLEAGDGQHDAHVSSKKGGWGIELRMLANIIYSYRISNSIPPLITKLAAWASSEFCSRKSGG
jgi:hypothetical protein